MRGKLRNEECVSVCGWILSGGEVARDLLSEDLLCDRWGMIFFLEY